MHERCDLPVALLRLARCQSGVLARSQLTEAGVSKATSERLCSGWTRLAHGVYLMSSDAVDVPWLAKVWTGILLGGHGARAAGHTAAALDGLTEPAATRSIQVLVPHGRQVRGQENFRFSRERPGVRLGSLSREPPRTRIEDTTLDLCAEGSAQEAIGWLTRACQRRLTTVARLVERAEQRRTLRHRVLILEVLSDVAAGATSALEHRALTRVLRPHGLPTTRLQHRTGSAGRIADAAIPEYRLLIEFDGRVGHVEEGAFRDRQRDNAHTVDGWTTLRFGWSDVANDPCGVAALIGRVLADRGWPASVRRCSICAEGTRATGSG